MRRLIAAALALALVPGALAYTIAGNTRTQNDGLKEWPGGAFTWRMNSASVAGLQNTDPRVIVAADSNPKAAAVAAMAAWAAEGAVTPTLGADTSVDTVGNDGTNIITFVDTATNRSTVGGALAVTALFSDSNNNITGADITFNPDPQVFVGASQVDGVWSTTGATLPAQSVLAVMTHETGHWMGLAHSGVVGATMYPFAADYGAAGDSELIPASISPDDRAGLNQMYPRTSFTSQTGRITGTVTEGGLKIFGAHVVAENIATGVAVASSITLGSNAGALFGKYDIRNLPPGSYHLFVEPLDLPANETNWCKTGFTAIDWFDDTACNASPGVAGWDKTFLTQDVAAPVAVTGGSVSTVDIAVTNGTPAVNIVAIGSASLGCPGGGSSFSAGNTPVLLTPGTTADVAIRGTGLDGAGALVSISDPTFAIVPGCESRGGSGSSARIIFRVTVPPTARPGPRTVRVTLTTGELGTCTGCLEVAGPATETGNCANGIDDDGDGLTDNSDAECFSDLCPGDPAKTAPGQCGCGVPDTDTDGDGTADCLDGCDNDPLKTAPGTCGCGVPDTDTDGDGAKDCVETCDNDPGKTVPGVCGCGVPDTDTDGDGAKDCVETCDNDPGKTAPGVCGCGVPDTDTDGDGAKDCVETCDNDPGKTAPGACGCGVADTDTDADGTADCNDNCPDVANADQADVNGNGVGDACEAVVIRIDRTAARPGGPGVAVRVFVDTSATGCVSTIRTTIGYDDAALDLTGTADPRAGCVASLTPLATGSARLEVTCNPGVTGGGRFVNLVFTTPSGGTPVDYTLDGSDPVALDCTAGHASLSASVLDGSITAGCVLGDIFPEGAGNGSVSLADFVHARRKALGTIPQTDFDKACGDVHPGVITCQRGAGASNFCIQGNGQLSLGDVVVLRRVLNNVYALDCAGCAARTAPGPAGPGDIAPQGGDGSVDVADAVLALRAAVGLGTLTEDTALRADVSPSSPDESDPALRAVAGDGRVDVSDVVLLLRASVGLESLAWPERALRVELRPSAPAVAWRVTIDGWPADATPSRLLAPGCDEAAGIDAVGSSWAATCATDDAQALILSEWRYRARRPVDLPSLRAAGECADARLAESPVPVALRP